MEKKDKSLEKKDAHEVKEIERTRSGKIFIPAVDILETGDDLVLMADMPGVDEKSINITLENDVLTIEGNVEEQSPSGMELNYTEYETGDYQRSFTLSDKIDRNKIQATYSNGVLELKLPKAEPAKPQKIKVKSG